ncbi:hypothetical protein ACWDA9_32850, partial [Streptomyces sp. NPDC001193]
MSDAALPSVAEVRAAAEAVKAALDRHLAAVESRIGDEDPAVYAAFNELAAAAEEYDEQGLHPVQVGPLVLNVEFPVKLGVSLAD